MLWSAILAKTFSVSLPRFVDVLWADMVRLSLDSELRRLVLSV